MPCAAREPNAPDTPPPPPARLRVQKKKIWEAVQPGLRTTAEGVAAWKELPMRTASGPVTVRRTMGGNVA